MMEVLEEGMDPMKSQEWVFCGRYCESAWLTSNNNGTFQWEEYYWFQNMQFHEMR